MSSPARRVLGSKNPNAPLQQQPSKPQNRNYQTASPASARVSTKRPLSPATSLRIGQKRKIEILDEGEQGNSQEAISAYPLSQATDLMSDVASDHEEVNPPLLTHSKSTLNTISSSFCDSQEETARIEPEFHILEEPSQQTLDTMVCCSYEGTTLADIVSARCVIYSEYIPAYSTITSKLDKRNISDQLKHVKFD